MKQESVYTEKRGPLTIRIEQDPDSPSPEEGDDNLFLVHYHRDFWAGKKEIVQESDFEDEERMKELRKSFWIFGVAAYIHSGVRLSLGSGSHFPDQQWDVSHCGAVFVSKKEWRLSKKARKAVGDSMETRKGARNTFRIVLTKPGQVPATF